MRFLDIFRKCATTWLVSLFDISAIWLWWSQCFWCDRSVLREDFITAARVDALEQAILQTTATIESCNDSLNTNHQDFQNFETLVVDGLLTFQIVQQSWLLVVKLVVKRVVPNGYSLPTAKTPTEVVICPGGCHRVQRPAVGLAPAWTQPQWGPQIFHKAGDMQMDSDHPRWIQNEKSWQLKRPCFFVASTKGISAFTAFSWISKIKCEFFWFRKTQKRQVEAPHSFLPFSKGAAQP